METCEVCGKAKLEAEIFAAASTTAVHSASRLEGVKFCRSAGFALLAPEVALNCV